MAVGTTGWLSPRVGAWVLGLVVGVGVLFQFWLPGELMIFTHARELKDYVIQEERS